MKNKPGAGRPQKWPKEAKRKCYVFKLMPEQEKVVDQWINELRKKLETGQ